jgi:hypothetical protein
MFLGNIKEAGNALVNRTDKLMYRADRFCFKHSGLILFVAFEAAGLALIAVGGGGAPPIPGELPTIPEMAGVVLGAGGLMALPHILEHEL